MTRIILAALIAISSATANAAPVQVDFAFTETYNSPSPKPMVTGRIVLADDQGTTRALSLRVLSNTAGYGIGEYVGNPSSNSFTIMDGQITDYDFVSIGNDNTAPAVTDSSLLIRTTAFGDLTFAGLQNDPSGARGRGDVAFSVGETSPAVVPLPAGGALGASALGLLAFLRRRSRV